MRRQDSSESSISMQLLAGVYKLLLVGLLAVSLCIFTDLPLGAGNYLFALAAYTALLLTLHRIYQACEVGRARVSELVLSQTLSNLISLSGLYVCISLYVHRLFNPLPMLAAFVLQELLGLLWGLGANRLYFKNYIPPRTAIVYSTESLLELIRRSPYFREKYNVCRLIKDPGDDVDALIPELRDCEVVFVADVSAKLTNGIAKYCAETDVKGFFIPRLGHIVMSGAEYVSMFSAPMLKVQRNGGHSYYRVFKRAFDIVVSLVGIVVLSPVMLATAICIHLEDKGPVFYRQTRLTRNGREFSILKFRSMTVNAEQDGVARLAGENDSRITRIGHFIRACRIDELPQLFNILLGDMSIVGPRPERPEIAKQYEQELPEFGLRLQVKAGLTGMAQVYGRYNTEPYHKLQMDLMYINLMSFMTDLRLIVATVKILFVKDSTAGVEEGQITAASGEQEKKRSA